MEIDGGDMKQASYADQVTTLVQGFVQIWNKFEAMSYDELAKTESRFEGISSGNEPHPHANYELFYRVSSCIHQKHNLTMGELSSALSVPLSTATRIVDWLVAGGYVQRLPDPKDRRVVRVVLSNIGKELHQAIESYTGKRVQQILSCLTAEEQAALFALFHKIVAALKGMTSKNLL